MLPKPHRLTKTRDFENVHQKGKFISEKFLAIKFLKNNLAISRFGILVGVKVSKKAAKRNKVKRRISESIRLSLNQIRPGFDVVVLTKPEIIEKTYQEIDSTIKNIFRKAKLLTK